MKYLMLVVADPDLATEEEPVLTIEEWGNETYGQRQEPRRRPAAAALVREDGRRRNGKVTVTDGPFAETHEWIAGFDILECETVEEAIEVATRHPMATHGTIELRPVWPLGSTEPVMPGRAVRVAPRHALSDRRVDQRTDAGALLTAAARAMILRLRRPPASAQARSHTPDRAVSTGAARRATSGSMMMTRQPSAARPPRIAPTAPMIVTTQPRASHQAIPPATTMAIDMTTALHIHSPMATR